MTPKKRKKATDLGGNQWPAQATYPIKGSFRAISGFRR